MQMKSNQLESERLPMEEKIKQQKNEEGKLLKQLGNSHAEKEDLFRLTQLHEQKNKSKDSEICALRSSLRERDRKLRSIEGELVHLADRSNEKELRHDVKSAYQKFIAPTRRCLFMEERARNKDGVSSPQHETPKAKDASVDGLRQTFEKRLKIAEGKAKMEIKAVKESLSKRMGENTILIQDCDTLRQENSELKTELARMRKI